MYDHINCLAAEIKVLHFLISTSQREVNKSNGGSPLSDQTGFSISAQQPRGAAGIITTSLPATGAQLAPRQAFHHHKHVAQDDIQTERAI